jgi:hypothetical protein
MLQMRESLMRPSRLISPTAPFVLTAAGVTLSGLGLAYSDRLVETGFAAALHTPQTAGETRHEARGPAVAGSEEFWLGRRLPDGAAPASFHRTWAVGERFPFAGGQLEVTAVRTLTGEAAALVGHGPHPLMVTCRNPEAPGKAPLDLIVNGDEAVPASLKSASTL